MKILVFDNYDSFTYNLVHLVDKITNTRATVVRNDQIPLEAVAGYDKIILSPGPGIPEEAGALLPLLNEYAASKNILGVCLGHQAIGQAFGASLTNLSTVYHGVATPVNVLEDRNRKDSLFHGLGATIEAGRYHSWVVDRSGFPDELEITAEDEKGYIMALRHRRLAVQGLQFHPESVLTPDGEKLLRNWLKQ